MGISALGEHFWPEVFETSPPAPIVTDSTYAAWFPDTYSADTQAVKHMVHRLAWQAYGPKQYAVNFFIPEPTVLRAQKHRESGTLLAGEIIRLISESRQLDTNQDPYATFWTQIYIHLLRHDQDQLPVFFSAFDSLFAQHQTAPELFANLMVSFVQDMPYQLVHDLGCPVIAATDTCEDFSCNYHQAGRPCKPNVRFGVQSPVEFLYDLAGDCDTRVLLLQLMFHRYGYDAKIVISQFYRHAVIGVRLPASGRNFVMFEGHKYYMWETTARNWQLGYMGPEYSHLPHWTALHTPLDTTSLPGLLVPDIFPPAL